jgi:dCTP diphosphatase
MMGGDMQYLYTQVSEFLTERGWDELSPADLAKSICIESAELLEHFQWSNPSAKELLSEPDKVRCVSDEIADVIIYALEMCVILRLDPDDIVSTKLARAAAKYPAEAMTRNRGVGPANSEYHDIKAHHRPARARGERK